MLLLLCVPQQISQPLELLWLRNCYFARKLLVCKQLWGNWSLWSIWMVCCAQILLLPITLSGDVLVVENLQRFIPNLILLSNTNSTRKQFDNIFHIITMQHLAALLTEKSWTLAANAHHFSSLFSCRLLLHIVLSQDPFHRSVSMLH